MNAPLPHEVFAPLAQGTRHLLAILWPSPWPAVLQDARFHLVDANDAWLAAVGREREDVIGRDPVDLQPEVDREASRAERAVARASIVAGEPPQPALRRIVDGHGRERWFLVVTANVAPAGEPALWLSTLQDQTDQHAARAAERRAQAELDQWFALADSGMLVFDADGLVRRSNLAFESLVGVVPVSLAEASPELQALLAWPPPSELVEGAPPLERQGLVPLPGGGRRRLRARVCAVAGREADPGPRPAAPLLRLMAVVEDRSAEDERDLARLEIGMLMDTASVGVATFDPQRGWLQPPPSTLAATAGASPRSAGLQGIHRDLIEPSSIPEYERLQQALRGGERLEVRYAVRHPTLGRRWLQTRVEPGALAGGRRTTSVVTLDVTEQESAARRNEQLLRELTTILDGSTAGIAYLRGERLVRCNRRFERMLGLAPGAAAGASVRSLFGEASWIAHEALAALDAGRRYEAEIPVAVAGAEGGGTVWYSVSMRRADTPGDEPEAVAVLTDVSRLKTQAAELQAVLRERELMFSLSEVGIVYQRGARIERANQAMAALSGWSPPELSGLDPVELHADARACVEWEARAAEALRQQGRHAGERMLRRRDGALRWVQVVVRPVDEDDLEAGTISSYVDIDERRRSRDALLAQAERTRAILDSVLVGIVTVSEGGIEWMNRSARRMFAGELSDFAGEPIATVATAEPAHPLRRTDWLLRLPEGQAETFECRLQARDGRTFWVVGNAVVTAREKGARQLTFALLDIQRRRHAEMQLQQAQASLRRVLETAPLAFALFDAAGDRVQQVNAAAAAFFGRPAADLLGRTPTELLAPAAAARLTALLAEAGAAGSVVREEWRLGGEAEAAEAAPPAVWDVRIVALDAGESAPAERLLVASDVTAQRAADEKRLHDAIAQREALVREVHHRIKNNLQGVAGLLQQSAARRPEIAGPLAEAVGQVQAIAQVHGLQVGAGGPLALASVVEAVAMSVARGTGRAIEVEAGAAQRWRLPEVEAIPLALCVNELLSNAVRHGAPGAVRCTLADAGAGVGIEIRHPGTLPPDFELVRFRSGVAGLGLVRALLPRRSARLSIVAEGADVITLLVLEPPGVVAAEAPVAIAP
jgi:PAS domain S-box-containing protein